MYQPTAMRLQGESIRHAARSGNMTLVKSWAWECVLLLIHYSYII